MLSARFTYFTIARCTFGRPTRFATAGIWRPGWGWYLGNIPVGKQHFGGISKRGRRYVRTLLIHGGRAVVQWAARRPDTQGRWLCGSHTAKAPI